MEIKVNTWRELKEFANSLTDEQLDRKLFFAEEERPLKSIDEVVILDCPHINPSGEAAEPITDYLPGGQFYDPEFNADDEEVVADTGFIYLCHI